MTDHGTCGNCRFAYHDKLAPKDALQCRRHAPQVALVGMAKHSITGQQMPVTNGFFPPVNPDVFCWEWEPEIKGVN